MVIIYLNSEAVSDLEFDTLEQRDEIAKSHPEREIYGLNDFQNAFNSEEISDLGLMYFVEETDVPSIRRK